MSKDKFSAVELRQVDQSELILRFDNESDMAAFRYWWARRGSVNFKKYHEIGNQMFGKDKDMSLCRNCRRRSMSDPCKKCCEDGI